MLESENDKKEKQTTKKKKMNSFFILLCIFESVCANEDSSAETSSALKTVKTGRTVVLYILEDW